MLEITAKSDSRLLITPLPSSRCWGFAKLSAVKEIEAYYSKTFLARQGATLAELRRRLCDVAASFEHTLQGVDDEVFYEPITPGKWSPAQIADHLVKANALFARALATPTQGGDIIQMARGRVTEDGRPIAPQEEEPAPDQPRAELRAAFNTSFAELIRVAQTSENADKLFETCIYQSFFGPMTGLELLQLAAWHTRHHEKQLPNFER